jgi:hypothetical protein
MVTAVTVVIGDMVTVSAVTVLWQRGGNSVDSYSHHYNITTVTTGNHGPLPKTSEKMVSSENLEKNNVNSYYHFSIAASFLTRKRGQLLFQFSTVCKTQFCTIKSLLFQCTR